MTQIRVIAPAKINLGLAVLGKRPDGYHEIDTIMSMVDLADELSFIPTTTGEITLRGMEGISPEDNLIVRAIRAWNRATGSTQGWEVEVKKNIPAPAGLGGGSSDAAAALRALNAWSSEPLDILELHNIADKIGSDCPFFLGAPCARATGTGTLLRALQPIDKWLVIAVPRLQLEAKTAASYAAIEQRDYLPREDIDAIEEVLSDRFIAPQSFPNSFMRVAETFLPEMKSIAEHMKSICGNASLSGAGPGLYGIVDSEDEARQCMAALSQVVNTPVIFHIARTLTETPTLCFA